jgi:hypothetical protein
MEREADMMHGEVGADELGALAGAIEQSTGLELPGDVVQDLAYRLRGIGQGEFPTPFRGGAPGRGTPYRYGAGAPVRPMPGAGLAPARKRCGGQSLAPCAGNAELPLPFDSVVAVGAGLTVNVVTQPQANFQPYRILVPTSVAPSFVINNITIGTRSQFSGQGALSAEVFQVTAVGAAVKMDMAYTSQNITFNVTNVSVGAVRFFAAMIGEYCY